MSGHVQEIKGAANKCSISGCEKIHSARGWCDMHYTRFLRHGSPLKVLKKHRDTKGWSTQKIFDHFTIKNGECLEWTGTKIKTGYGRISIKGSLHLTHRLSWVFNNGEIPEGLCVLHKCDNPSCVNIDHLFLGTQKENVADCCRKKRRPKGSKSGLSILNEGKVLEIVKLLSDKKKTTEIAKMYKVSIHVINNIKYGSSWSWLTQIKKPKQEVSFSCCVCGLPRHPEGTRVSHGMHETCFLVHDPESYRGMLANGDDTQPVTGNT